MAEEIYEKVRKNVKILRTLYNLSQADFGQRVGLEKSSISQIESGKRMVTLPKLELMAKVFGLKTTVLIEEDLTLYLKERLEKYKLSQ